MWTSTIDLGFKKVFLAHLIGHFYRNIYFSSYSPLQVQNLPRQSLPKTSWVRVRNHLSGIGGSDLHLIYGDGDMRIASAAIPTRKYLYPGQEVVGEVIEIGDDVQHLHVGDRVALQYGPNCFSAGILPLCRFCAVGNYNLCENVAVSPQPIGGGWSEEMLVHEQQLFRLPDSLTDEQAVMLEPTAVALHAALRRIPKHGERVLIIGAGSIGLLLLQIMRTLAPQSEVSVLARHAFQVERATRLGAAHIIYPRDAYIGVKRATQAKLYQGTLGNQTLSGGYDVIYDTVGRRQTVHNALRWTRAQGTIVLIGVNLHMMNLDLTPVWYQEINLLGSTSHGLERWPIDGGEQRSTFEAAIELIQQGRLAPEQLITHHFALNNYKHALLTTTHKAESRAIKVVFDYSLLPASVVPNVRASAPRRRPVTVNFDYPVYEEEAAVDRSQEQDEQGAALKRSPYTPAPYTATIQDTPPLKSPKREMPQLSTLPAVPEYDSAYSEYQQDDDESDDTAAALPIVNKHSYSYREASSKTSLASDDQQAEYSTVASDGLPAYASDQAVAQEPEEDDEPDIEVLEPTPQPLPVDTSSTGTIAAENDEDPATSDSYLTPDAEPAADEAQKISRPLFEDSALPSADEHERSELAPTEQEAPAESSFEEVAAELDPQTIEPDDDSMPIRMQRSRTSSRKRRNR